MNGKIDWKAVFVCAGAFVAYHIGSGFASGQEVLQYFGSWGEFWPIVVPLVTIIMLFLFCCSTYYLGNTMSFDKPSDAYEYYCGKYFAKFMDVFSIVMIIGIAIVMFAGCGAALNQYFGIPVYVGAIFMGVVSVLVVWLGLEKLTNVLGICGVIIVVFVAIVGLIVIFKQGINISDAQKNLLMYVEEGKVLQAGLLNIKNPIFSGLLYAGMMFCCSFPFAISLGTQLKTKRDVFPSAVVGSIMYLLGILCVLLIVLMNLDYIVSNGSELPTLTAVQAVMPILALPFTIIIVIGIFTTITGYLWLIGRRFAKDKTTKQRIIVLAVTVFGITAGSLLPFSKLVNTIYPFTGVVGLVLFLLVLVKEIQRKNQISK